MWAKSRRDAAPACGCAPGRRAATFVLQGEVPRRYNVAPAGAGLRDSIADFCRRTGMAGPAFRRRAGALCDRTFRIPDQSHVVFRKRA